MLWLILLVILLILVAGSIVAGILLYKKKENCFKLGCKDGQICSRTGRCIERGTCLEDADCLSGKCVNNLCESVKPLVEKCKHSGECTFAGFSCVNGICKEDCANCIGECINNKCHPRPCVSSIDCPGGQTCSSMNGPNGQPGKYCNGGQKCDKVCPADLICIAGECRECNQDNKENCGKHVCRKETCIPCSPEVPCEENKVCTYGVCCPKEDLGKPCTKEEDCPLYCVEGKCSCTLLPEGEKCTNSASCLSGNCQETIGRCSVTPCLTSEDCTVNAPFCAGQCTNKLLGSNCPAGEESICTQKGYFCPAGICQDKLPEFGERCLTSCVEGLECKQQPNINTKYKYCLPK